MVELGDSNDYMPTKRLETLVDGIFAIAMTLLVLGIAVPEITGPLSNTVVANSYYGLLSNFFAFILSFLLLAVFWNGHHRIFNQIKVIDNTLLWINVIWLLFIVLVPFSAASLGQYGSYIIPNVIFNSNMLGIGIFLYLNSYYAMKKNFIKDLTPHIKIRLRHNIGFILIATIAFILSFIISGWSTTLYALLIPLNFAARRINS